MKYQITWAFVSGFIGLWFSPPVKGSRPPPCSGFSLTMTDEDRAMMVRGYTPCRTFTAHVLHLPTMVSHLRDSIQGLII